MMQDHSLLAQRETESRESPIDSEEALCPLFQSTVCANDWDKPLRGSPGWLSGPSGCPFSILFSSAPLVRSQLRARLCQQVDNANLGSSSGLVSTTDRQLYLTALCPASGTCIVSFLPSGYIRVEKDIQG